MKVQALLTGKVQQRGDLLNVQAELVDVKQNAQLWGDRFNRRGVDLLNVEDEIAQQIVENLRLTLTGEERARLARRDTENTDAYHLYLKGRYYWSKRTPPDLKKSIEYFEQAIAKDPGYALAYTGLASAYVVMTVFDIGVPTDLFTKAKTAALQALEVDSDLAEALAELILIQGCLDRDWESAEDACRRATQRRPGYWLAHDHYAMTLAAQGRFDDAIAEVRRGQALEPLSVVVHHHVAWIHVLARRYDVAIAECRSAIDMDPNFPMAHCGWASASSSRDSTTTPSRRSNGRSHLTRGASIAVGALAHAYAIVGTNRRGTAATLRTATTKPRSLHPALRRGTRAGRARRIRRGRALAGAGLSRSLVLAGLLGRRRSPARRGAARRSIQDAAAPSGTHDDTLACPFGPRLSRSPLTICRSSMSHTLDRARRSGALLRRCVSGRHAG